MLSDLGRPYSGINPKTHCFYRLQRFYPVRSFGGRSDRPIGEEQLAEGANQSPWGEGRGPIGAAADAHFGQLIQRLPQFRNLAQCGALLR
jgi:hypothetical protein